MVVLYALALSSSVLTLILRGLWRKFPLFLLYAIAGSLATAFSDPIGMSEPAWQWSQAVMLVLRFGCCVEVMRQVALVPSWAAIWMLGFCAAVSLVGVSREAGEVALRLDIVFLFGVAWAVVIGFLCGNIRKRQSRHAGVLFALTTTQVLCIALTGRAKPVVILEAGYLINSAAFIAASWNFIAMPPLAARSGGSAAARPASSPDQQVYF